MTDGVQTYGVGATFQPDHFAEMTWYRCSKDDCHTRVDPWDHNKYCPKHRGDHNADVAHVHSIWSAARRRQLELDRG